MLYIIVLLEVLLAHDARGSRLPAALPSDRYQPFLIQLTILRKSVAASVGA